MKRELLLTRLGIVLCLLSLGLFYRDVTLAIRDQGASLREGVLIATCITALVYGSLVYLLARCGCLRRGNARPSSPTSSGEEVRMAEFNPDVCVLIPSYKEEIGVLRQTIVSAALAEFQRRRIVVLIDDPPSQRRDEAAALQRTREMVLDLQRRFAAAVKWLREEESAFALRSSGDCDPFAETRRIADLSDDVAHWIRALGDTCHAREAAANDHTDRFFSDSVIAASADAHASRAAMLRAGTLDLRFLAQEYRRLVGLLDVNISSFERKQYANLSHAPNKAMNLNSYIGLMGKHFRITVGENGSQLEECDCSEADPVVPETKYLLTLDADSVVRPSYVMTLVDIMEREPSIAVAQTPYSAVPGSCNRLERAAGAQTDVQYLVHQGFTAFNATFWVGANALLRLAALRDIETKAHEHGKVVPVFIQDRTVIEDTGSTIDLVRRGWRLHNHPERLAYSATPPDFGSLIIQRRRWSNGGLIILPDLLRHALRWGGPRPSLRELLMRVHYLCSPALVGVSVLVLLLIPVDSSLQSPWVAATALPYYAVYARDLRLLRYRWRELPQIYALGLMLVPVNLAGVLRSMQQIITGRKSAFGRTPKVEDRTPTPPIHLLLQLALPLGIGVAGARYLLTGHYGLAFFCAFNLGTILASIALLIGTRNVFSDLFPLRRRVRVQARVPSTSLTWPRRTEDKGRIVGMDGLRAYAISLVFMVHFLPQYFNGSTNSKLIDFDAGWSPATGMADMIARYYWASHYGVDLFFLLSGFLIYRLIGRPSFSYLGFLRNRFIRLYPAFATALVIYCLYAGYFWNKSFDWLTVAANLLMLQGVWELGIKPIIVPTWSLTFEWLFYLAFPLVLLLPMARKGISRWHIAFIGVIVALTIAPIGPHYIRFLMFLAGALLASLDQARVKTQLAKLPDLGVLTIYVLANLLFVMQQDYYRFIPVFLITSSLLVAKVVFGDGLLNRLFSLDALCRLGAVSYSFYLFHPLVIIVICDHLGPLLQGLPETIRFVVLLACSFACSSAVASVFYRLMERPYFQWRSTRLLVAVNAAGAARG